MVGDAGTDGAAVLRDPREEEPRRCGRGEHLGGVSGQRGLERHRGADRGRQEPRPLAAGISAEPVRLLIVPVHAAEVPRLPEWDHERRELGGRPVDHQAHALTEVGDDACTVDGPPLCGWLGGLKSHARRPPP